MELEKRSLYRFPWSLNDNPIGWLEITDICNIHCRGCYRLRITGHKPMEVIQEEVRFLKRWRNCDNISIAGGEPLSHPRIVDIVAFIKEEGIKPFMLTNGVLVKPDLLRELRRAGLVGIGFHVDMFQERPHWQGKNEIELCELRQQLLDMVQQVDGLPCGFGITVYRQNFPYIPDLVRWALRNRGKVQGLTFITYRSAMVEGRDYLVDGKPIQIDTSTFGYVSQDSPEEVGIRSTDVYRLLRENFPEYQPAAYLGGTQLHDSFKWLAGYIICSDDQILGSIGPRTMELVQVLHHWIRGTYVVYMRSKSPGRKVLLAALFDPQVRRALRAALRRPISVLFKGVYGMAIGIIQAPDVIGDGRVDMCDSCPDMTFYEGKLVHSCRLDEHRKFGQYVTPIVRN